MVSTVAEDMLAGQVEMIRVFVPLLLPYKDQLVTSMWEVLLNDANVIKKAECCGLPGHRC